jgi:hypothetical protein
MKVWLGLLLVVLGIALGLYVGVWLCLIGGIVQFVEAVKMTPVDAWGIAFGIARFFLASVCGMVSAMLLVIPGAALIKNSH